jgi:type I restriction enzyme S subunit
MIADLKPYPEYKESGLAWLGPVPGHWSGERAKWLFTKMDRPVGDDDGVVTCFRDGMVTLRKNRRLRGFTEAIYEFGYQGIRKGDLVIHAMDAFAGAVGVSDSDGKATPVYAVCQPKPGVSAHYYSFIIREMARSQWILALSRGIRERSTDFRYDTFGGQSVPLPPPAEQAAIVRFLDWANGRLDRAIRAKRKVIALLNEQKQVIIHRVVTRGLDPSVPLKPSGIPWLGDIPKHWELRRLKWVLRLQRGFDLPADRRKIGSVPVYSSGGHIDNHDVALASPPGIVIGRYGSTDAVFFVTESYWPHNTALFTTTLYGNHARWCFYLLRSFSKGAHAGKSAVPGVDRKDLFDIVVPRPPIAEQSALAAAIDKQLAKFDRSILSITKEIGLLHEYRNRLVADVVTGKLDVRNAAAQLPEEVAAETAENDTDLSDETEAADEEAVV